MFQLWLMRHGEAAAGEGDDGQRPLTERGRQQVVSVGRWLAERAAVPTLIWHSPLRRARETARAVAEAIHQPSVREHPLLAPGMNAATLLAAASQTPEDAVLCVGHQPDIGQAVRECLGGGRFAIPPGTLFCIEFAGPIVNGGGMLRGQCDPAWFGG